MDLKGGHVHQKTKILLSSAETFYLARILSILLVYLRSSYSPPRDESDLPPNTTPYYIDRTTTRYEEFPFNNRCLLTKLVVNIRA